MGLHTSLPERPWEELDIGIPVASVATARRADTRNLGTQSGHAIASRLSSAS